MLASTPLCKLHSNYYGYKWPKLHQARKLLDPLTIRKHRIQDENHRASDDAFLAGHILLELIDRGAYQIQELIQ